MSLTVRSDRALIREQGGSVRYALVDLTAPEAVARAVRPAVNLAIVLDRSGSMGGQKIVVARQAVAHALCLLTPRDRVALVAFDDEVDRVVGSTPATREARRQALSALDHIDARGTTNLAGGWNVGCAEVAAHLAGESIGRCLLVTDGQANRGETDPAALGRLAAAMRQRGVATSTFGIGADFDERTLQQMAEGGQGHFYFVENVGAIPDLLASELGDALEIVAREAALVLHLPEGVGVEPLGPFRVAAAGRVVRIELGDLTSGQELRLVLKFVFRAGAAGETRAVRCSLVDRESALGAASQDVVWTFADRAENLAQPRDRVVDRAVAGLHAAIARHRALELNQTGRYDEARRLLERVARKIAAYAGDDPELRQLVVALRAESEDYGAHMEAMEAKRRHFASYNVQHRRMADGKAVKRV